MKRNEVNFSMKKILSLVLVMAMLLSAVPMTWAAEQDVGTAAAPKHYASLVLKDSIAINFKVTKAWLTENAFEKAEFLMNGEVVQTINGVPAGNTELAVFSFTKLTPAQMSEKVTVRYCFANMDPVEKTYSVLDYSKSVLEDVNENPLLKTAIVDMLSYGAAAQTYNKQTVNAELNETLTTYASLGTAEPKALTKNSALTGDEGDVKWLTVGLNLKDSVTLRFKFSTPEIEGLTLKLTSNGQTWEITKFEEAGDGNYYAYFSGLNPAQLRQVVYGEFYAYGDLVSNKLAYSVESYAADNASDPEDLKALTAALMVYGDSVYTWAYTYLAGKDLTYIEAEDVILYQDVDTTMYNASVTLNQPVITVNADTKASGGKVANLAWGGRLSAGSDNSTIPYEKKPAHLSFNVLAEETATYYIWVRFYGGTTSSKTIYTHFDGKDTTWKYELMDNDGNAGKATGDYSWHRFPIVNWTAGKTYTVRLRTRDGLMSFDKFVVTTDVSFAPFTENGLVSVELDKFIEAENVTLNPSQTDVISSATDGYVSQASGNKYLQFKNPTNNDDLFIRTENNSAAPSAAFQVTADAPGTYYVWGKFLTCNAIYQSISASASQYTYSFYRTSELKLESQIGVDGWYQIGSYTATEAGEVFYVCLLDRAVHNRIDQFFVTSKSMASPHVDHSYDNGEWASDATHHWQTATCGCAGYSEKVAHDFGTTGICECGKVGFYIADGNQTYIEAEDVNLLTQQDTTSGNVQYVNVDDTGKIVMLGTVGGGAQGYTTLGNKDLPAHLSFNVKANANGKFYIWAKVSQKDPNVGTSHYCYIDGVEKRSSGFDFPANYEGGWAYDSFNTEHGTYKWVKIAICDWQEGETYSVRYRARAQIILIDQFMVTSDANFTPTI